MAAERRLCAADPLALSFFYWEAVQAVNRGHLTVGERLYELKALQEQTKKQEVGSVLGWWSAEWDEACYMTTKVLKKACMRYLGSISFDTSVSSVSHLLYMESLTQSHCRLGLHDEHTCNAISTHTCLLVKSKYAPFLRGADSLK